MVGPPCRWPLCRRWRPYAIVHSAATSPREGYNRGMASNSGSQPAKFHKPSALEAFFNRAFGYLVGLGLGPGYMRLLQVRGRKTGRVYSSPVNLLEFGGKPYLVAPRGRTQWVRNAEAAGEI